MKCSDCNFVFLHVCIHVSTNLIFCLVENLTWGSKRTYDILANNKKANKKYSIYKITITMFIIWLAPQKKELGQYPAILTSHLINNPYILLFSFQALQYQKIITSVLGTSTFCANLDTNSYQMPSCRSYYYVTKSTENTRWSPFREVKEICIIHVR